MILLSLITPRDKKELLDRFYVKMKTPVDPDPEADKQAIEASYADPARFDDKRLVKAFGLEFQRFSVEDVVGFVVCFLICFALIWVTIVLANLGA
jgi:SSS family solute:Na+ symporter